MINSNILEMFKSHKEDPPYSILITNIEQKNECNQESVVFTVHQINKPISEIEKNKDVIERKLHVVGNLSLDDNNLYKTSLLGFTSDEKLVEGNKEDNTLLSHYIEILDTKLSKTISIEFNNTYYEEPRIFFNISKENESLYGSYSFEWKTQTEEVTVVNENDISVTKEVTKYIGVDVIFNYLKTKRTYPKISIIIVGDLIKDDRQNEPTENNEPEE